MSTFILYSVSENLILAASCSISKTLIATPKLRYTGWPFYYNSLPHTDENTHTHTYTQQTSECTPTLCAVSSLCSLSVFASMALETHDEQRLL